MREKQKQIKQRWMLFLVIINKIKQTYENILMKNKFNTHTHNYRVGSS